MINSETAGRVEGAIRMPMEDVRLAALCHLIQWIDGDWQWKEKMERKEKNNKLKRQLLGIINNCLSS